MSESAIKVHGSLSLASGQNVPIVRKMYLCQETAVQRNLVIK